MPVNWEALNYNMRDIGSALAERSREKKQMQDAFQMLMMKAQIEQMARSPYERLGDVAKTAKALYDIGIDPRTVFGNNAPMSPQREAIDTEGVIMPQESSGIMPIKRFGQVAEDEIQPTEYEFTPFGGMRPTKGVNVKVKLKQEEEQKKMQAIYGTENQAAVRKTLSQLANINSMEETLYNIPSGRVKGYGLKIGAFVGGGAGNQQIRDTAEYEDFVQANAAGLYRDLTGDNRLSDKDAQARAMPLIPRPQQDRRLQIQKFAKLKYMLRNRAEMLQTSPEEVDLSILGKGFEQSQEYDEMQVKLGKKSDKSKKDYSNLWE